MELKYLPINIKNISGQPDKFNIAISESNYIFKVFWNAEAEIFTFDLYDGDENSIVYGRKFVYGVNLLENIIDDRVPEGVKVIPFDKTGKAEQTGITFDNFMDSVKPYIVGDD